MKTYVLTVSSCFPKTHKRAGESTGFVNNLSQLFTIQNTKIHTIRANYQLWEKRAKEINEGKAMLSIRYWSGKPYNSKQVEICRLEGIGIEKLEFVDGCFNQMLVNGIYCFTDIESSIAKNDGLSFDDFIEWFKKYDLSKSMAIIHFTNFRYNEKTKHIESKA